MSCAFRIDIRQRWAAREAVVHRWIKKVPEIFRPDEPLVEIRIDGRVETLNSHNDGESHGIIHYYAAEGEHVGPWGYLLEYSTELNPTATTYTPHAGRRRWFPARQTYRPRTRYPRVFLSYRRQDGEAYAGRLHGELTAAFGTEDVFMDIFSIRGGEVFPWTIQQAAVHAEVMVALIGPHWFKVADAQGRPRLEDERDFVRREIVAAMDRGTPVLPVLLPGAEVPSHLALHAVDAGLSGLSDLQMSELSPRHWNADAAHIVASVRAALNETQSPV